MWHMQKNALKFLRRFILLSSLCLSGCVWWVDGAGSHHSPAYYDLWFEEVEVYCEYDPVDPGSLWTVVATVDSLAGYDEIDEVYVTIAGSFSYTYVNSFRLTPNSFGTWSYSFYNHGSLGTSYYCGSRYDFEFVAYDDYNNYVTMWYYW